MDMGLMVQVDVLLNMLLMLLHVLLQMRIGGSLCRIELRQDLGSGRSSQPCRVLLRRQII